MHGGREPDALGHVGRGEGAGRDPVGVGERPGHQHLAGLVVDEAELGVGGGTADAQRGDVVGVDVDVEQHRAVGCRLAKQLEGAVGAAGDLPLDTVGGGSANRLVARERAESRRGGPCRPGR